MSEENIELPGRYTIGFNLPKGFGCADDVDWSDIEIPEKIEFRTVSSWEEFFEIAFGVKRNQPL